jgi:hypothetical protein
MKTITSLFLILAMAVFSSCEGPMGPPGLDGEDGFDGTSLLGSVFEIEGDFTDANGYELYYEFPSDFEIYDTDIVMVYMLWEVVEANDGSAIDVWRALPQTIVLDDGVIQYNFDYTVADVKVFMEFTVSELLPAETDGQVFRIAVLPADWAMDKSIDINSLNSVMKSLEVNPNTIKKFSLTK